MKLEKKQKTNIDITKKGRKSIRKQMLAMVAVAIMLYSLITGSSSYPPNRDAQQALESNNDIVVTQTKQYILFSNEEASVDHAYMLYPHDDINPASYAPLAKTMSKQLQTNVFIVKYPFNYVSLGVLSGKNIASQHPDIKKWNILFHGNGGLLSNFGLPSNVNSLLYASSYPLVSLNKNINTMVVRGSLDEVNAKVAWQKKQKLFPTGSTFYEIPKGNFSYFANFGLHPQDSVGLITENEQQQLTLEFIEDFHKDFN